MLLRRWQKQLEEDGFIHLLEKLTKEFIVNILNGKNRDMCIPWKVRGVGMQAHPRGAHVNWGLTGVLVTRCLWTGDRRRAIDHPSSLL